jgi:hypothetical protein
MTQQVLGKRGSPRRRWTLLLPLVAALVAGLFYIAGAQGVHIAPSSNLQLDRDASSSTNAPPAEDWDLICKANPATCTLVVAAPPGSTTAVESTFQHDAEGATTFDTGGSKDDLDIPSWRQSAGSSPPKDELSDGFAALYQNAGDSLLYFGADRFANNGSAQIGFWFFQNTIAVSGNAFSGTHRAPGKGANGEWCSDGNPATPPEPDPVCTRDADDTPGDLLILSDFTQGGAISTIRVFEWVGTGGSATSNGTLEQVVAGVDCRTAVHPPDLCGTVNGPEGDASDGVVAPWDYSPKFGTDGTFPFGSLYEGGVNLSDFGFGGACFASFLVETRSSPSVDATLKDFVLGQFSPCTANIVTVPVPGPFPVTPGTQVRDKATITTSGLGAPAPTGTVAFRLCGPALPTDPKPLCATATSGISAGSVTLTGTPSPVEVFSNFVNTAGSPLAPGVWCFRADWTGDPNYDDDFDNSETECFEVAPIPSTIATVQRWLPNDSATISTTGPAGYNLTGSVTFSLYGPGDTSCAGTPKYQEVVPITQNTATPGLSETVTTTNGDGIGTGLAADFVVNGANDGTYSWKVEYAPTDSAHTGSNSACNAEHTDLTITEPSP